MSDREKAMANTAFEKVALEYLGVSFIFILVPPFTNKSVLWL